MKSEDETPRDKRTGTAGEEVERAIAEVRTAVARSEEGRTMEITEHCRVRFRRWFAGPER